MSPHATRAWVQHPGARFPRDLTGDVKPMKNYRRLLAWPFPTRCPMRESRRGFKGYARAGWQQQIQHH